MHDAIVVGTGPAGGLAALRLAEAGVRVLVLEKATLPRDKPCGGALSGKPVQATLGWDFSELVEAEAWTSRAYLRFERPVDRPHGGAGLLVSRRRFDLHIIERALAAGDVTLRDGCAVERVEENQDGVAVLLAGGERCRGRFLVGADGAAGRTAASLGLGRRTRPGAALDADVEVPAALWEAERARMTFNFAAPAGGYGWTFPKDGYLSCGVGAWRGGAEPLPRALDRYLAGALPPGAILRQVRRGHPIPLWEGPGRISTRRVCLTGDAASLVDPILGEGIRYALASGAIAAETILEGLGAREGPGPGDDGLGYTRRVRAAMGDKLERIRTFIQPMFLARPETFYRNFYEEGRSWSGLAASLDARLRASSPDRMPAASAFSAQS